MLTAVTEEDWTIVLQVFAASRSRRGDRGRKSLPVWRLSRNHRGGVGGSKVSWCGKSKESRMKTFDYVKAASVRESLLPRRNRVPPIWLPEPTFFDLMKGGVGHPSRLVDISHLPGLDRIETMRVGISAS